MTIPLGAGNVVVRDDQVAVDNQLGVVALESIGVIAQNADVIGYGQGPGAERLLSFDTAVSLTAGVVARPGDVVSWNGASHSIVFSAAAAGLPPGVRTDAVSQSPGGLLLSFDTDVLLPGPLGVADEDLVRWNGSAFSLVFDGSAAGLDRRLDVDGAQDLGGGRFLVSFDTGGATVDALNSPLPFQDEDVLRYANGIFSLEVDGSSLDTDWGAADLDAFEVPEPEAASTWMIAVAFVALLGSMGRADARRSRRRANGVGQMTVPLTASVLALGLGLMISLGFATQATARDGVAEINQACATATGCFSGDAPGFPVTIDGSAGMSYRLTSDLVVPFVDVSAILLQTPRVRLHLAGHSIEGPVVCTGRPVTSCTPGSGTGSGIEAALDPAFPGFGIRLGGYRIWGGTIRGMGSRGVLVDSSSLSDLRIESNAGNGVEGQSLRLARCLLSGNLGQGLASSIGTSVVRDSAVHANGAGGIEIVDGLVTGNSVEDNGGAGIRLLGGSAGIVADNSVRQNAGDGIASHASPSLVFANHSASNASDGIDADESLVRSLIHRNLVEGNAGFGLRLGSKSAYRENAVTSGTGPTLYAPLGVVDLGANACNGGAVCP
ncbi:MAG: right-handed parallel beta-helix repeat-containing protein [Deltaproteobacteria bacterium]|nr:right-handed parallel beta-helix repeat-containing protein [Deltaproteobacteria bacterium]